MAGIEGVAAYAGEVLRRGVVLEEASAGGGVVNREQRGARDGGEAPGVQSGLDPAEILDAQFGGIRVGGVEEEGGGFGAEIEQANAAVAVADGELEVRGGGFGLEEVVREGEGGPPDSGDEGGGGGGGGRGEGEGGDELHRVGVEDGDGAAGSVGEEAGGGEVGGSAIVLGGRPRQNAVP